MYVELVKALRETHERVKSNPDVAMFVPPYQLSAAADAIEELSREYECVAVSLNESSELIHKLLQRHPLIYATNGGCGRCDHCRINETGTCRHAEEE